MGRFPVLAVAAAATAVVLACSGGATTEPGIPTPQNLEVGPGAGRQVFVSWSPVVATGLDHYVVYARQGGAPPAALGNVVAPYSGQVFPRLQAGTWGFAVEAVDKEGRNSPRSAEVTATLLPAAQAALPRGTDGAPNGYYEYLPPGYGDGEPRPLLIYWHGSGAMGNGVTELDRLVSCCPPGMVNAGLWPSSLPFVVLSPQSGTDCDDRGQTAAFIAWALEHYSVDPKRVYLTGMSCGSMRSWDYLAAHTDEQVAAAWLLAGDPGTAWSRAGCDLGKVAIWAMHGTDDLDVPISPERGIMQQLLACPSPPRHDVVFTEVPGAGHEVAWEAYLGPTGADALAWLLAHAKP
jgi:predicted esterase